ncbi:Pol protein [Phytophthora palmivora]|uniref:Pol protein n=1 Tax=Phytophthora palmivora TaxID=4796 RepID=A0A2P4XAW1_9STRA|nr:Pol protein [Phytophthora palmivora]
MFPPMFGTGTPERIAKHLRVRRSDGSHCPDEGVAMSLATDRHYRACGTPQHLKTSHRMVSTMEDADGTDKAEILVELKARDIAEMYIVVKEFSDVVSKHPSLYLPPDRGVQHEIDLVPDTKYNVTRQ